LVGAIEDGLDFVASERVEDLVEFALDLVGHCVQPRLRRASVVRRR
jgi:hypothetical protein